MDLGDPFGGLGGRYDRRLDPPALRTVGQDEQPDHQRGPQDQPGRLRHHQQTSGDHRMGITLRLLALGLVWTSCGGATTGLAGELEKLEAALAKTSSFSAHFIQKTYNPLRDKTVVLSGRLSWMRPGLVRFEYQEPDPLLVVV